MTQSTLFDTSDSPTYPVNEPARSTRRYQPPTSQAAWAQVQSRLSEVQTKVNLAVVFQVDDDLRGAAVGNRPGEKDGAALAAVRGLERIVRDRFRPPRLRDFRIAVDAELRPRLRTNAKDRRIVVIAARD